MSKTLKSMTVAEAQAERAGHRRSLGFLGLQRKQHNKTAAELDRIDADILKRRRRIARLERRIEAASRPNVPTTATDPVIQPINWGGV